MVVTSSSFAVDIPVFTDTDLEKYSRDTQKQEYYSDRGYENEKGAWIVNKNWIEENNAWCQINPKKCLHANNWCHRGMTADLRVENAGILLQRTLDYPEEAKDETDARKELRMEVRERRDLYEEAREGNIPLNWLKCKF